MKQIVLLMCVCFFMSCAEKKAGKMNTNSKTASEKVLTPIPQDSSKITFQKLQGTWNNIDAPLSALTFQGDKVINTFDGVDTQKNITFKLSDSCGTNETEITPKEENRYIITAGQAVECYYIVKLNDTSLVLGLRGMETALRFKKQ